MLKDNSQQSIFGCMCKSAQYAPYVHEDEANAVKVQCAGRNRRNIVTCSDEGVEDDIEDVGGLDMLSVSLQDPLNEKFSNNVIPIIPKDFFKTDASDVPYDIVGVSLEDIFTKNLYMCNKYYVLPKILEVNKELLQYPIFKGKKVILFSTGRDILIERLHSERHESSFFNDVSSLGFFAVTGMNFSLFCGECALSHILNLQKSLRYCESLDLLYVNTIPHVYALNERHREKWKNWLLANPKVKVITINLQLQKRQKDRLKYDLDTIIFLLKNTEVNVILHGYGRKIPDDLLQFHSRITVAASAPLMKFLMNRSITIAEHIAVYKNTIGFPKISSVYSINRSLFAKQLK